MSNDFNHTLSMKHGGVGGVSGPRCMGTMRVSKWYATMDMSPEITPYDLKCNICSRILSYTLGGPLHEPYRNNVPCVYEEQERK